MFLREVIASIKDELDKVECYRTEVSLRYPENPKNPRAVRAIRRLSSRLHYVTDVDWETIQTIFAADPCKFKEIVSRVARRVGYRNHERPGVRFFLRSVVLEFNGDTKVDTVVSPLRNTAIGQAA